MLKNKDIWSNDHEMLMIPTKSYLGSHFYLSHDKLTRNFKTDGPLRFLSEGLYPHHLYMTGNEKDSIQIGDIHIDLSLIKNHGENAFAYTDQKSYDLIKKDNSGNIRKIIATTNRKLLIKSSCCDGTGYDKRSRCRICDGLGMENLPDFPYHIVNDFCNGQHLFSVKYIEYVENLGVDPAYYGLDSHKPKILNQKIIAMTNNFLDKVNAEPSIKISIVEKLIKRAVQETKENSISVDDWIGKNLKSYAKK